MIRTALAFLLLALSLQARMIGGTVTDEEGRPLAGAHVQVEESGCTSDLDGKFRLHVSSDSPARLRVSFIGFQTLEQVVTQEQIELGRLSLRAEALAAEELVFSADSREQTVRSAVSKVDVVTRQELERAPSQELSRVLELVPGVSIKRSDGATTNSLSIRGSSNLLGGGVGNRVLLLVDGRPMLRADRGGPDWTMVPLAVVERVEVAKGSYSSLYGSAAMGGVVHLVTKRRFPTHLTLVQAGYGLGELPSTEQRFREMPLTENHLSVTHMNQLDNLGYYLSYAKRESNGHRENSGYLHHALATRFRLGDPNSTQHLELNLGLSHLNRGFPHSWDSRRRPLHLSHHHPEWIDDRQEKSTLGGDLSWQKTYDHSQLRLAAWTTLGLSKTMYHDSELGDTRSDADAFGFRGSLDLYDLGPHELILGLEILTNRVDGKPDDIFYGKHHDLNFAVFVQDQVQLPRLPGGLTDTPQLQLGLRADRHVVAGHSMETLLSPKLGLNLPGAGLLDAWTFRASVGTAFRNPTIADLFLKSVPGNDYTFVANPGLKAEESHSYELGLDWRWSNLHMDLSVFRYDYRDMIHYRDTDQVSIFEIVNLQTAEIEGWELSTSYTRSRVQLSADYTFVDARNGESGEPLPYQPKHHFNGNVAWSPGNWKLSAGLRHVSETEKVRFYASDAPDAFTLFGLKLAYDLGNVEVSGAVENLGDVAYEEMERYRMPGRVWRLDLLFRLQRSGL